VDKDVFSYSWLTYLWVVGLSAWGGVVSWLRKKEFGQTWRQTAAQVAIEMIVSTFVGLITFVLCHIAELSLLWTIVLVAISGHAGAKALTQYETFLERLTPTGRLGAKQNE
jgi:hypothetical protein